MKNVKRLSLTVLVANDYISIVYSKKCYVIELFH
jgi:hypothetical protein